MVACVRDNNNSIKIGVIFPMTGKMSKYGKTSEAALTSMLDILNSERIIKGMPKLELIVEDNQCMPKAGLNAAIKLVEQDKVDLIIGAMASSITLAIAPYCESKKVLYISPGSSSPSITHAGDYIFRTVLSDTYESKVISNVYNEKFNGKKLAIMYINNDFGVNLKTEFIKNTKIDPKDLLQVGYNDDVIDFKTYLNKIKSSNVEVVYLVAYEEMIKVFQQAFDMGLNVQWLSTNQLNDQSLIDRIGKPVEGTIFPAWQFSAEKIKEKYPEFYKNYLLKSGNLDLDVFAANSVDALLIYNSLLKDRNYEIDSIKNAIYCINNFEGLTGSFSFDENGDVNKKLNLCQIRDSKIVDAN